MNAMWVLDITFRIKASFSVPEAARKRQSIQVFNSFNWSYNANWHDRQSHLMSSGLQMSAEKTLINVTHLLLGNYRDEIGWNCFLGEIASCSCLTVLPGPALFLLNNIYKDFKSHLWIGLLIIQKRNLTYSTGNISLSCQVVDIIKPGNTFRTLKMQ